MATLPSANTTVTESPSAYASGLDFCVVMAPVAQSADYVPRVVSSTSGLIAQYGYSDGVDYAALHFAKTRKPIIFVGMPIATAGTAGSFDNTGVTGTSQVTVSAGANGVMTQISGVVTIVAGTTVGTDQIAFSLSCDGGLSTQKVRLGTATSYTIPYLGIVLNFGAGTLNVGDTFTFLTTAPMWGSTAITAARQALAAFQNGQRSWLVVGDVPNATFAGYVLSEANNYASTNKRFVYARTQASDRLPLAKKSKTSVAMVGAPSITFSASAHTVTRATGSFVTDGFVVGQVVTISGSVLNNGVAGVLTAVSATVLTFASGLVNEGPISGVSITASSALTFAASGNTITQSGGGTSFLLDGFAVGQSVTIAGTTLNNGTATLTAVAANVLTFSSGIVNEGPLSSASVSVAQSLTKAAWISAQTAAFASIDASYRIDIAIGRRTIQSQITGWNFRRPSSWGMSLREYTHDVQIPTYRKADGPLDGWGLADASIASQEYDETVDGGALAGRFSCFRSYSNGPAGVFVALSLTRDSDNALLSRTHNMAVVDLACTVVQAETENAIGQVLALNADGTGTEASLCQIEERVNTQLQINLLQNFKEGPRASSAVWVASRTDNLSVAGATLNGILSLLRNGTLEQINTTVAVS